MEVSKIALIGNPNTGKTSLFNLLTGLNQQVGNFPGVTVDKKSGSYTGLSGKKIEVIDLPGTYSVFPRSNDERVVFKFLTSKDSEDFPQAVVVVADTSNLERNLLLFTQLYDLGIPLVLALTMPDVAERRGYQINLEKLSAAFNGVEVVMVNGRNGEGLQELKAAIERNKLKDNQDVFLQNDLEALIKNNTAQTQDAKARYKKLRTVINSVTEKKGQVGDRFSQKLDRVLVHPVSGYAIFIAILLVIFQAIFNFASVPMDFIDGIFGELSQWTKASLPQGAFVDLLAEGIIPGIGGVVVFVPQIALLFTFLTLLEETGYMARVVFIMDRLMRPFGLNGKSVVPLMSSVACAIPGIMATRSISSWKDRMITILVAPLMSCSARIPVYTLLIALVIPDKTVWGFFNLKGLVLFALYAMGVVMALIVAAILNAIMKSRDSSFLLLELPSYRTPRLKYVGISVLEKVKVFVMDAGKIILAISIVLWAMASYGPGERIEKAISEIQAPSTDGDEAMIEEYEFKVAAAKLENSYIGILGKAIEPAITPLGYDWKIGISLITSFAAREVFVGSMATIYSVGEDFEEDHSLLDRLKEQRNPDSGERVYSLAAGCSLMVFYVFAMQCMATMAVVKRETRSWKWPFIQLIYMGLLAYIGAFITFNLLS